jgi:DNA-binding winged helix-turn-helix (wHTH) protein/tetratricopeptide (TPR) repeat protein
VVGATQRLLRFGAFELNLDTEELSKSGAVVRLPPQPFKLLALLAGQAGQVLTREEIREQLWGDASYGDFEHGVNRCINQIRTVLADNADNPLYIETIPRRGYRFVAPVVSKNIAAARPRVVASQSSGVGTDVASQVRARIAASLAAAPGGVTIGPPQPETATTAMPSSVRQVPRRVPWAWMVAACFVLVALLAAGLYWRAHTASPLTEKDPVVLADFENKTGDPVFDGTLRMALAIQLEQSPFLNVLSEQRVNGTLKLMGRPANERLTSQLAREICLRTNSKAMLEGSIAAVGEHYLIAVRAVNCRTGDTLASTEAEAENRNHVLAATGAVASQLRKQLGESLASMKKFDQPLEEATTSSLEALQAYTRARRARLTGEADPIPLLNRALELDPNFAEAYARLGPAYEDRKQTSLAIQNYKKAYELRNRVSQRERFYIEAHYYADATGQLDKAIPIFAEWSQTYPAAWEPHVNLSYHYAQLGQYEKSAAEARETIRLVPDTVIAYRHLVEACNYMNRPNEAKAAFDEAQARKLDDPYLHLSRYYTAFLERDSVVMRQQLEWAMGTPEAEDMLLSAQSDTEAYYGRFDNARRFSQRAAEAARRTEAPETAGYWIATEALREAEIGNANEARELAKEALSLGQGREVETVAALALATAGDAAEAQRVADRLDRESPMDTLIQGHSLPTIRALVELDRNDPSAAIEALQLTSPYETGWAFSRTLYPPYVRGLAYLKAGQPRMATAEFRKLLDSPGLVGNSVLVALVRLQLGRAYAMMGDKEAARKSYQDFLTLWKDADPDTPIYTQAKAAYAKLN